MKNVLKKYDTRVLFGAGNMCRNYMKCYGEEFPPLFTCDNNSGRWGEIFEGLQIRPPEALKDLAPDCAIFICNIYYREIEKQLREMGLFILTGCNTGKRKCDEKGRWKKGRIRLPFR